MFSRVMLSLVREKVYTFICSDFEEEFVNEEELMLVHCTMLDEDELFFQYSLDDKFYDVSIEDDTMYIVCEEHGESYDF